MKSDHVVMNDNEEVEEDDGISEVVQNDDKSDEVVEDDILAPRTTMSGKTYARWWR